MSSIEICLIDAGLKTLKDLQLNSGIINLNVHCNKISKIENLTSLTSLKHLDLSSNSLRKICGLSACCCLQTLNLSCNIIQKLEGIEQLKHLRKLNVSYNQINDVSGFKSVSKISHPDLSYVELHGNNLSSLKHILQNLNQCNSIKHLYLKKNGDGNPVCDIPAYRPNMISQMPWLESLDGKDKYGKVIANLPLKTQDIPGLDEYLELLEPLSTLSSVMNDDASSIDDLQTDLVTPKIDTLLKTITKKKVVTEVESQEESEDVQTDQQNVTDRLESLEDKLSTLVQLYTKNKSVCDKKIENVAVYINPDTSVSSSSSNSDDVTDNVTLAEPQVQKSKVPVQRAVQEKKIKPGIKKSIPKKQLSTSSVGKENIQPCLDVDGTKMNKVNEKKIRDVRSTKDDETFLSLMNEMDSERERRWKAEQASRKLLDTIKELQERLVEERKIQEAAISSAAKLKTELTNEKESRCNFESCALKLENENCSMKSEIDELRKSYEASKQTINTMENTNQRLEKEKTEEVLFHQKRYKELQLDAGGWNRELELLRNTVDKHKGQLSQLQELLVSREQEHKNALLGMVSLESKEVRDLISSEVSKCETRNAELMKQNVKKLKESKGEYAALEDEFRMALQIEANRYNELYTSYENNCEELTQLKGSFEELTLKEAKSRGLLSELSALVKEQKVRITEINKCKCDMQVQYKDRVTLLENEVSNLRKVSAKFESTQQDKDRMAAHIRGQESIIQGLRSERKLWGQELAQQGASLAQEKGRIDAKVESQQNQITSLEKQLRDDNDTLKIKSKLIEDQTNSIREMKEEIRKLNDEKKNLVEESKKEVDELHDTLERSREQNEELQESVNVLTDRKVELKSQLATTDEDLQKSRNELKTLRGQWEERSKLIDQFETKVMKLKTSFDEKEKKLIKEKEIEIEKVNVAEEKIKEYEGKFKTEIATMKHDFNLELRKIISQKDDEIQKAKEEVSKVEEEMRVVLLETDNQKKSLESRLNNLSKAFSDIQRDLT